METRKLPNTTTSLVLGILSFLACCCSSGIGGVIFSGIALYLAKKDEKLYMAEPEAYNNYDQLKTAKIVALVGLVLAALSIVWTVYQIYSHGGWQGYMEYQQEMMEELGLPVQN